VSFPSFYKRGKDEFIFYNLLHFLFAQEMKQRRAASEGLLDFLTSGNQGEPSSDQLADVSPLLPLSKKIYANTSNGI